MKWPDVNPGEMTSQITILAPDDLTSDISGSVVGGYSPFLTTYAKVESLRGIETVHSGQITGQIFLIITIVYQPGIKANMRVQGMNGTYLIQEVINPSELNVRLDLLCLALGDND
jgi:SPP1 family predicted phage head-tail adaptor